MLFLNCSFLDVYWHILAGNGIPKGGGGGVHNIQADAGTLPTSLPICQCAPRDGNDRQVGPKKRQIAAVYLRPPHRFHFTLWAVGAKWELSPVWRSYARDGAKRSESARHGDLSGVICVG